MSVVLTIRPEVSLMHDGDAESVVMHGLDIELHGGVPVRLGAHAHTRLTDLRAKAHLAEALHLLPCTKNNN